MNEFKSVIERLKKSKSVFPALISGGHGEGNYILSCYELSDIPEYAIYKKNGANFSIVDFFNKLDDANKEATEILKNYPNWIESINCRAEHHQHNIAGAE